MRVADAEREGGQHVGELHVQYAQRQYHADSSLQVDDAGVQVGHRALSRRASHAVCVHLLHVAMTTDPFITDHLFVPLGITVKQLSALPFQVVQ